jgi:hypothetical protein
MYGDVPHKLKKSNQTVLEIFDKIAILSPLKGPYL